MGSDLPIEFGPGAVGQSRASTPGGHLAPPNVISGSDAAVGLDEGLAALVEWWQRASEARGGSVA